MLTIATSPSISRTLPANHSFKRNENVFPFRQNLSSLEVFHLVALVTGAAGQTDFGIQRFRWLPGILDYDLSRKCELYCDIHTLVAHGDKHFSLYGRDLGAEQARARQSALRKGK
jgi:molybdopterin-synthase adenylyltransferase